MLEDPNGWRQFLGQRLLVHGQVKDAIGEVRTVLQGSDRATARLHALWTLDGLGALTSDDIVRGLEDPDPHVRRDSVKLSSPWLAGERVFRKLREKATDPDARVRLQVVLVLGETDRAVATELLVQSALRDAHDPWFARGLLTSSVGRAGAMLSGLIEAERFTAHPNEDAVGLIKQLATAVGARGDASELSGLLGTVAAEQPPGMWWRATSISGLGQGLPRHRGDLGRTSLPQLLANPPDRLRQSAAVLRDFLEQAQQTAIDPSKSATDRAAAVELLAYRPFHESAAAFKQLLHTGQPVDVQMATVDALAANGSEAAAHIVLDRWSQLSPSASGPALSFLLGRVSTIRQTLEAMTAGKIRPAALSIDQRVRLLKHSDATIKQLASQLFGGAVSSNRRHVLQQYREALTLKASAQKGASVFKQVCANCHRIDGVGHQVGPDISDARNRSKVALLHDILDPNAKVEPRFASYTVVTESGRVFDGLIASETAEAVVLRMAEGKQQTIGRGEINEVRASNVSLMPEGVEKDISLQDMANLLEFLKARWPAS